MMSEKKGKLVKVRIEGTQEDVEIVANELQRDFWVLDRSLVYPTSRKRKDFWVCMMIYPRLFDESV